MAKLVDNFEKKEEAFRSYYDTNLGLLQSAAEVFKVLITALLIDVPLDNVSSRVKDREECISKFKRKYLDDLESKGEDYNIQDHITDLIGLRVVCLHLDDINKAQNIVLENFKEIEITDKISILNNTEDKFGYKSLHLDLKINDTRSSLPEYAMFNNIAFELQIRTIIQDAWSVLDHKIKYKKSIPLELKRRINRLAALFEVADDEFLRIKNETQKEQEKAKTEVTEKSKELSDSIDVFKFLLVAENYFPTYDFIEHKADGFVSELLYIDPNFSTTTLIDALEKNKSEVELYYNSTLSNMNPYTIIRHCIYMFNKEEYKSLLYHNQRLSFDDWNQKSHK